MTCIFGILWVTLFFVELVWVSSWVLQLCPACPLYAGQCGEFCSDQSLGLLFQQWSQWTCSHTAGGRAKQPMDGTGCGKREGLFFLNILNSDIIVHYVDVTCCWCWLQTSLTFQWEGFPFGVIIQCIRSVRRSPWISPEVDTHTHTDVHIRIDLDTRGCRCFLMFLWFACVGLSGVSSRTLDNIGRMRMEVIVTKPKFVQFCVSYSSCIFFM